MEKKEITLSKLEKKQAELKAIEIVLNVIEYKIEIVSESYDKAEKEANERRASNEDIDFNDIEYYEKNLKKEFVMFRKIQEIKDIIEKLI